MSAIRARPDMFAAMGRSYEPTSPDEIRGLAKAPGFHPGYT